MAKPYLTQNRLKEVLSYDPDCGQFRNKTNRGGSAKSGGIAGYKNKYGYLSIRVDGRLYQAHRLAWLYIFGVWPKDDIDHINGDPSDNRIHNLRDVPHQLNAQNIRKPHSDTSPGALLGTSYENSRGKWVSKTIINGKQKFLGRFDTKEEAHAVYLDVKRKAHKGCTI